MGGKQHAADVRQFIKVIQQAGVVVDRDRSGHYSLWHDGKRVGTVPYSPSDYRWRLNVIRDIRLNTGIDLHPRKRKKGRRVAS